MTKKVSRIIASFMLIVAAGFFVFALGHPEMTFPWSNTITYVLYALYAAVMGFFFAAPFKKK